MACNDSVSNVCIESKDAKCIDYKGTMSDNTKLTSDCVTQHDVNEDTYYLLDDVIEKQNTSNLGEVCISYPLTEGVITPKSVFETHEQEICAVKERVQTLEDQTLSDIDITSSGLDFACLVDPCGNPITDLKTLLQLLINQACNV